jgi:fibronectin type 3 domain-containing protein
MAPPPPEGLAARPGDGVVELDWLDVPVTDLASYSVYRVREGDPQFVRVAVGLTQSRWTDSNVVNGNTYRYCVSAVDAAANESTASAEAFATPSMAPPTTGTLTLAWDPPTRSADGSFLSDLAGFKLYWGVTRGQYNLLRDVGAANQTTIDSVAPGTYYFTVTALDRAGNESAFSQEQSVTVP